MTLAEITEHHQPKMTALAYRMTGVLSVSRDIVHDVITDWAIQPKDDVEQVAAYLSKAVVNRCLNYLAKVKRERELYTGTWLPEPVMSDEIRRFEASADISFGFMLLLGKLTPAERAVFLLREGFDIDYSELSEMLDITQAHSRQLYHRAKERLSTHKKRFDGDKAQHQALLEAFSAASKTGDLARLVNYLNEEIMLYADGGGKVSAATKPIVGKNHVMKYIEGLAKKGFLAQGFSPAIINGEPGFTMLSDNGTVTAVVVMEISETQIQSLYVVLNPDKLPV